MVNIQNSIKHITIVVREVRPDYLSLAFRCYRSLVILSGTPLARSWIVSTFRPRVDPAIAD